MKLCVLALVVVFGMFLVSGCNQPANENVNSAAATATPATTVTATPDELAFARANYAKHCSACHGDEGKGGLVELENVKLRVPNLTEGHALRHTDEKFVKQITNGDDEMPAFKDKLSPDEINALVRFVRKEFQGKD